MIKIDALIVDSTLASRMLLRQALASLYNIGQVKMVSSLKDAKDLLDGSDNCDIVFIRHPLAAAQLSQFIADGKSTKQGGDCAYILVLKPNRQTSSEVAANLITGADGFVFEPYSVEGLAEVSKIAEKIRLQKEEKRRKAAAAFLIQNAMKIMEDLEYAELEQKNSGAMRKALKDAKDNLASFRRENEQLYFSTLLDAFDEIPPPPERADSRRERERAKLKERLEKKRMQEELKYLKQSDSESAKSDRSAAQKRSQYIIRKR